jgi:hypothetical protein
MCAQRILVIPPVVMAGLDPAIHVFRLLDRRIRKTVDHRVKPGDDEFSIGPSGIVKAKRECT